MKNLPTAISPQFVRTQSVPIASEPEIPVRLDELLASATDESFVETGEDSQSPARRTAILQPGENSELQTILELAEELFGEPATPFTVDWVTESLLGRTARGPMTRGYRSQPPVHYIDVESHRQGLSFGIREYAISLRSGECRVLNFVQPAAKGDQPFTRDIWLIPRRRFCELYYKLRRLEKSQAKVSPPLMTAELQDRIWKNTIGFLTRSQAAMQELGIAVKRGVLLRGEPGNGKTMAARWLKYQAEKRRLGWKTITIAEFHAAQHRCEVDELFQLGGPGVLFFDDFDDLIRRREDSHNTSDICVMLNELDGIDRRHGVVFLFASNLGWNELDHAIRRPGRIDLMIEFVKPDQVLRRTHFETNWPRVIQRSIDLDTAVAATEGLSFAEIEEVKTLLAMQHFDGEPIDWEQAMASFQTRRTLPASRSIGFSAA